MSALRPLPLVATAAVLFFSGCHIHTHGDDHGKDNVEIGTPFGSVHVNTDNKPGGSGIGLTPYPGATMVKEDKDDGGAADISLNFGDLRLGVHTVDLRTPDPTEKVLAFYKNDLARYGEVLTCHGKTPAGTPVRTSQGLTCATDRKYAHISESNSTELRAGSERHQHIVDVHTEEGATRIGLIALELPAGLTHHDESDRE